MKIEVNMLGKSFPIELDEGAIGSDLKKKFNFNALFIYNGLQMDPNVPLKDGDRVEIILPISGG